MVISTARGYGLAIRLFCEYLTDARYGWPAVCSERFGAVPQQVIHEGNSVAHIEDYEGDPGRRPFTYDEVQEFFDTADGLAAKIRERGRKGALTALRDAALLKVTDAYGLLLSDALRDDLAVVQRR